jgi:hypothetical protein
MYSATVRDLKLTKLSDEFGQYAIFLECACGHSRRCTPNTLAAFAGWDANLSDVSGYDARSAIRRSAAPEWSPLRWLGDIRVTSINGRFAERAIT